MDYKFFDKDRESTQSEDERRARNLQLTADQIQAYRDAFEQCDEDMDGYISVKDVGTLLKSLGQNPSEADLQQIKNEVEVDKNGRLNFDDFLQILADILSQEDGEEAIREAFRVFDIEGRGYMHTEEIKHVLVLMEAFPEQEVADMTRDLDINGDGRIYYDDFRAFSLSTAEAMPGEGEEEAATFLE
ncbi:calmodulin-alpha-like [Ptychodera flava]|uniref:calmodulin-alpha-like n=1 Tax=Ptychodera flava TaxID=63121 RepID=UPI00396A0FF2